MDTINAALENKNTLLKDIVAINYKAAEVFESYGIDFCCNGNRPLSQACEEKNVSPDEIINKLNDLNNTPASSGKYELWSLSYLIEHIVNNHHNYIREMVPIIKEHLNKVTEKHSARHIELLRINELFTDLSNELLMHLQKEERILFPLIKELESAVTANPGQPVNLRMNIQGPISMMEREHSNAGAIFEEMKLLSDNFTTPADGCATYNVTYKELDEFEKDLHRHIFLENSILFPKAIAMYE